MKIKRCNIGYSWNVNNCRFEMKKLAALTFQTEKCDFEIERFPKTNKIKNKTVTLIKNITNYIPFIAVSVLFLCITIILIGIMTYFCLKLKNNVLPH